MAGYCQHHECYAVPVECYSQHIESNSLPATCVCRYTGYYCHSKPEKSNTGGGGNTQGSDGDGPGKEQTGDEGKSRKSNGGDKESGKSTGGGGNAQLTQGSDGDGPGEEQTGNEGKSGKSNGRDKESGKSTGGGGNAQLTQGSDGDGPGEEQTGDEGKSGKSNGRDKESGKSTGGGGNAQLTQGSDGYGRGEEQTGDEGKSGKSNGGGKKSGKPTGGGGNAQLTQGSDGDGPGKEQTGDEGKTGKSNGVGKESGKSTCGGGNTQLTQGSDGDGPGKEHNGHNHNHCPPKKLYPIGTSPPRRTCVCFTCYAVPVKCYSQHIESNRLPATCACRYTGCNCHSKPEKSNTGGGNTKGSDGDGPGKEQTGDEGKSGKSNGGGKESGKSTGGGGKKPSKSTGGGGNTQGSDGDGPGKEHNGHNHNHCPPKKVYPIGTTPPPSVTAAIGSQHSLVMFGTTVMIPNLVISLMSGGNVQKAKAIQTSLFAAGTNTLLQSFFGARLPVVMGSSTAFLIPTLFILNSKRFTCFQDPDQRFQEKMRAIQGAQMAASLLPIFLGFSGIWRKLTRYLSPLSAVPLVAMDGLGFFTSGFAEITNCIEIGLPQLVILTFLSQYLSHMWESSKIKFNRNAVHLSTTIVAIYAIILSASGAYDNSSTQTKQSCSTDFGLITDAPWIEIPHPFKWGVPTVNAGEVAVMMAASIVSLIESGGTFTAASRLSDAPPIPPSVLGRSAGLQGIGLLINSMLGDITGSTASVESAGLVGLTQVGSVRTIQVAAVFMIFLSIFGKLSAIIASTPLAIQAATYCVLSSYTSSSGLDLLQFCNLNSFRTIFILGFSIFMGLSVPNYFRDQLQISGHGPVNTQSLWFNTAMQVIFTSSATVAGIIACFLDTTLGPKNQRTWTDCGNPRCEKFMDGFTDSLTKQIYSLPFNLGDYFPSL